VTHPESQPAVSSGKPDAAEDPRSSKLYVVRKSGAPFDAQTCKSGSRPALPAIPTRARWPFWTPLAMTVQAGDRRESKAGRCRKGPHDATRP